MFGLTLFRSILVLPIAIPIISLLLQFDIAGFLGLATFVIAAPYALFALWAWKRMARFVALKEAYVFLAKAPLIFAISICLPWFVGSLLIATPFDVALKSTTQLFAILVGTGYLYSGMAALIAVLAKAFGVVIEYKSNE